MSTTFGRLVNKLAAYPVRPGWFTKVIKELGQDLRLVLKNGSRVTSGGLASVGTVSATAFGVTTTAVDGVLNGTLKAQLALLGDVDLFTTAGTVAQAIYTDGSDASGIDLVAASGDTAWFSLVVVDSDGAGSATGENGAMLYLAVVAGTAATWSSASASPSDSDIEAALTASTGVHDGTTGWARLADVEWIEGGVSVVTPNRDA